MKEQIIFDLLKKKELSLTSLEEQAECFTSHDKKELQDLLSYLMDEGYVGLSKTNLYYLLKDKGMFLAKVIVKNRNFVILQRMITFEEYRISGMESDQLLIGDLLYAKEFQKDVIHCIDYYKATSSLKGNYSLDRNGNAILNISYLNSCGKKVLIESIDPSIQNEVNQGDYLEGEIVSFIKDVIKVRITKLLVKASDVGSDISQIILENNAPIEFSPSCIEEAKNISEIISDDDRKNRVDFTLDDVVTIDGDDAHDFDDAVYVKRVGRGYKLYVHIADVTHYVKVNHPLDDEAKSRGTSIYVADRVVPMLPFELSNGICSLNPNEERLTLSVIMDVDYSGFITHSEVVNGVIKSHVRLTYNQVNNFFAGNDIDVSQSIKDMLLVLHEVSLAIRRRREKQGAMKLDSTELKFKLDENGNPIEVIKETQGDSEKMIEDLMIAANCSVAKLLRKNGVPVLYRVHEFPPKDKLEQFKDYLKRVRLLREFPLDENISGERLNDFLASIEDVNLRKNVSYMMLRAMSKARYTPEDIGHFGLAELEYCHFTSPIRRYPDDIIHRLVKSYILEKRNFDFDDLYSYLEREGDELSSFEVRADHIQRECDDLESAKYMAMHIGETFHGHVVTMLNRGMFIETDLGIEGFLPYHCMHGDYFNFDEKAFAVFGKESDIAFTLGTEIDVKVLSSNIESKEINFATPEYYDEHVGDYSEEEREYLALNGIRIYQDDSYPFMSNRHRYEDNYMNDEENVSLAIENMEKTEENIQRKRRERSDSSFRPTPEQWKEVDVIRAVKNKYPDDENKVIEVLALMDIDEEEYHKLLRFTKPKDDKRSSRGFKSRGDRSKRDSKFSRDRKSYGDRKEGRHSSRSYSRKSSSRDDKKSTRKRERTFTGYSK